MSGDEERSELSDAALRASYIVTQEIDSLIERAEQEAERIRRDAERDAEDIRRDAIAAAERLLGRLQALEFPLGQLVVSLRDEVNQVSRELESGTPLDADSAELPPGVERPATDGGDMREGAPAGDSADGPPQGLESSPGEESRPSAGDGEGASEEDWLPASQRPEEDA